MKFGLLYIPDYDPDRYKTASHYYGEMLEQIQYQEELGFDGVFFAEHYVGGYAFPSPPVFAAAVAQRTKRIRLGTGVTLLPLSNPIRTAEEYAMLDVLSNGRLDFGVGRGVLKAEYELFDIAESESQGRFHESLEIILQAWTQDSVTFNGKYYKINDVKGAAQTDPAALSSRMDRMRRHARKLSLGRTPRFQSDARSLRLSETRRPSGQAEVCTGQP